MKIILITTILTILLLNNLKSQTVDGDPNYGIYHEKADVSIQGSQFAQDGFQIAKDKQQKKLFNKQKRLSLSPREKALKMKQDSAQNLNSLQKRKLKKIEKKEKKLEKLKGSFETDSATNKQMWTPTKKRSFKPFSIFKIHKKTNSENVADATRGSKKNMSKEQKKLTRINKKYALDSLEKDAKFKAESGFAISGIQYIRYKKALRKEYLLKKKTKKIYKKALLDIQSKSTKKMMKERAKENKKRDKKRSRKMLFRKITSFITFWN